MPDKNKVLPLEVRKADKVEKGLIDYTHDLGDDVKDRSKKVVGCVKRFLDWIQREHPTFFRICLTLTTMISVALFYLDVYTDVNATIAVEQSGKHPWWTRLMIFFLAFPILLTWIGILSYVRKVATTDDDRKKYTIYAVIFGPIIIVALDILMPFEPLMHFGIIPDEFASFIASYAAARTMLETFGESPLQLSLQTRMTVVCSSVIESCNIGENMKTQKVLLQSIVISSISMLWKGLQLFLGAKTVGISVPEYIWSLIRLGAGLPISSIIKNQIEKLNFDRMQLSEAQWRQLSEVLKNNTSVKSLSLFRCGLSDESCQALGDMLVVNKSLASINLDNFDLPIKDLRGDTNVSKLDFPAKGLTNKSAIVIAKLLPDNKSLSVLDLRNNKIGDDGAKFLAEGIKNSKSLASLNLDGFHLQIKDLRGDTNVSKLDFSSKGLTSRSAIVIAKLLPDNKSLSKLDLSQNSTGADGAKYLAEGIKASKSLSKLNLYGNEIGDDGAKFLAEGIKVSKSLSSLNLDGNVIGDNGAKYLAEGIKASKSLSVLDLGYNKIGDDGAKFLAEGIGASKSLSELNLTENNIGDDGAKFLAEGIGASKSLSELDLQRNHIGADGAKYLAEGIAASKSLSNLNLGYNKIGNDGAKFLAEGIKASKSLSKLILFDNQIGDDGAKFLAEGIGASKSLSELYLGRNSISEASKTLLKNAKPENLTIRTIDY